MGDVGRELGELWMEIGLVARPIRRHMRNQQRHTHYIAALTLGDFLEDVINW